MAYKDDPRVAMYLMYVREAHPVREPTEPTEGKALDPAHIAQHKTLHDRIVAASACREGLKLTLPVLIDTMDGVIEKAYRGVPAATAVVDLEGNLVFYARGPHGVQPQEARKALERLLRPAPHGDAGPIDRKSK